MSRTIAGRCGSVRSTSPADTGRTGGGSGASVRPLPSAEPRSSAWWTATGTSSSATPEPKARLTSATLRLTPAPGQPLRDQDRLQGLQLPRAELRGGRSAVMLPKQPQDRPDEPKLAGRLAVLAVVALRVPPVGQDQAVDGERSLRLGGRGVAGEPAGGEPVGDQPPVGLIGLRGAVAAQIEIPAGDPDAGLPGRLVMDEGGELGRTAAGHGAAFRNGSGVGLPRKSSGFGPHRRTPAGT